MAKPVTSGHFQIPRNSQSNTAPCLPQQGRALFLPLVSGGRWETSLHAIEHLTDTHTVRRTAAVGSHRHSSGASVRKLKREYEPYRMVTDRQRLQRNPSYPMVEELSIGQQLMRSFSVHGASEKY